MKLIQIIFCIYIFMKQFYFFSSGGLQPADLIFLVSFLLYFIQIIKNNRMILNKIDKLFLVFIYFVIVINLTHSLINNNTDFLKSCIFYIYNFMVIVLFRQLIKENLFLKRLLNTIKLSLVMQLVIYILGVGRWFGEIRYMGTFNDPNQMGFYVFISFLTIVVLSDILKYKSVFLYYVISTLLIIESSSTGIFLGMTSFTIVYLIFRYKYIISKLRFKLKNILKIIIIMDVTIIVIIPNIGLATSYIQNLTIFNRIEKKISDISSEDKSENEKTLIRDRGIDKLLLYPEYMLIGAGEGYISRFDKSYHMNEIHSTLLSILFYYGVIPFGIAIMWMLKNIRYIPNYMYTVYIALIIESFTLLNQRQSTFWIIFILGSLYMNKDIKKYESTFGGNND